MKRSVRWWVRISSPRARARGARAAGGQIFALPAGLRQVIAARIYESDRAVPLTVESGENCLDRCDRLFVEVDLRCGGILANLLRPRSADDCRSDVLVAEHSGKRELR